MSRTTSGGSVIGMRTHRIGSVSYAATTAGRGSSCADVLPGARAFRHERATGTACCPAATPASAPLAHAPTDRDAPDPTARHPAPRRP